MPADRYSVNLAKATQTCGVGLMRLLRNYGTDLVFGIPGVHTLELYRGIAISGMRHITPRHEQSAGFMADGYARATGKVGVCCLITGPGVTNAATALAQSYSDSVPILAISSVNKTGSLGLDQGDLHEVRAQSRLTEHFTAFSQTILSADTVPEVIAKAFAVFDASRPRPIHVEIPIDLIGNEVNWSADPSCRVSPPCPPHHQLVQAAELLSSAQEPVIVLGGGCRNSASEAMAVVSALNAPVVTTFAGKGVVPEGHLLSLGANLLHPPVLDFLKQADVVLAVGTHLSETDIWSRGGDIVFDGKLIRIDLDATRIYQNAVPHLGIVGDARQALEGIANAVSSIRGPRATDRIERAQLVQKLIESTRPYWYKHTESHIKVWQKIRSVLPDDGIVTADSTQLVYSGNYCYPARLPRTYLTSTTGYGTLGYALPAAIGAKLGKPDCPVVCVTGDGGFMFTVQELATAVELRLPVVIVLWHNDGYGEIRDRFNEEDIPLAGVDLEMPDFLAVARGFGCRAISVERIDDLPSMLKEGFQGNRPTLLELRPDSLDF